MNVEEFFEFCRTHPEERYEYIHGYAYLLTDVYFYRRRRIIDVAVKAAAQRL